MTHVQHLTVPDDGEGLIIQHLGVEDAAVVGRGHHHFAVGQHLRRLGAGFPPNDVILDAVELAEGPVQTLLGVEGGVHSLQRHPVGHQRELEIDPRRPPHAAAPRKFFQVEEVSDGGRLGPGKLLQVVSVDGGVEQHTHPALGEGAGVDGFQQSFVTSPHRIRHFHIDHVPVNVAGFDLGPNLGQSAVVVLQPHIDPGFAGERPVKGLFADPGVGTAPGNHGQRFGQRQRPAPGQDGQQQDRCGRAQPWPASLTGPPGTG